jgi:integrase/recombinase XerD
MMDKDGMSDHQFARGRGRRKGTSMNELLQRYIDHLRDDRRLSDNTLASYQRDLSSFMAYLDGQSLQLADATRHHLAKYVLNLKEQGKKPATTTRHIVSIRAFFHYLAERSILIHNPAMFMESPKLEARERSVLSESAADKLLQAPSVETDAGKRDKAMLELLYATGIRVTELVTLNVEHVHLQLGYVACTGTGMKERLVPFGRPARAALELYLAEGRNGLLTDRESDNALFLNHLGTRLTRQGFWKTLKKYAKAAGLEDITPHTLRHSVAVHMLGNGADARAVQELMGHADLATTLKYANLPKMRLREAYSSSHPRA